MGRAGFDRRMIYLLMGLVVVLPILLGGGVDCAPGKPVLDTYAFLDRLPPGSRVWFGYDAYASSSAEIAPAAQVVAEHLLSRGCRLVVSSTIPDGALLSRRYVGGVADRMGKKYGVDYCILGYKSGDKIAVQQMCADVKAAFPTDLNGTPTNQLPVLQGVHGIEDFACVFTCTDNRTFDYYAIIANSHYGVPVMGSTTAVSVPELYSYVNSGQIHGLLGGLRGAAEYEGLRHRPGTATAGMMSQSAAHFLICLLVVVSNVSHFRSRRPA